VAQLERLLEVSKSAQVKHFVFSSSAVVYGQPDVQVITEDTPANPINTYGKTKLEGELLLDKFPEMSIISLRYFNVAGASSQTLADTELQNLIPISIDKIEKDLAVHIYGDTFPTPDGTCVRDYIHNLDIAETHFHAMELVRSEYVSNERINLGTGLGKSVKQVLSEIELVSGLSLKQKVDTPWAGDPAKLVASSKYAKLRLGWTVRRTFAEIIRDSWQCRT
jgi:UDP-glucose 4-epimerase